MTRVWHGVIYLWDVHKHEYITRKSLYDFKVMKCFHCHRKEIMHCKDYFGLTIAKRIRILIITVESIVNTLISVDYQNSSISLSGFNVKITSKDLHKIFQPCYKGNP